jgi:hypothetical protein
VPVLPDNNVDTDRNELARGRPPRARVEHTTRAQMSTNVVRPPILSVTPGKALA